MKSKPSVVVQAFRPAGGRRDGARNRTPDLSIPQTRSSAWQNASPATSVTAWGSGRSRPLARWPAPRFVLSRVPRRLLSFAGSTGPACASLDARSHIAPLAMWSGFIRVTSRVLRFAPPCHGGRPPTYRSRRDLGECSLQCARPSDARKCRRHLHTCSRPSFESCLSKSAA